MTAHWSSTSATTVLCASSAGSISCLSSLSAPTASTSEPRATWSRPTNHPREVVHVTQMSLRRDLGPELAHGTRVNVELARKLTRVALGLREIGIEGEHLPDRPHSGQCSELTPALLAASAHRDGGGVLASEMARRHGARGGCARTRDLDGVENGKRPAVDRVVHHDDTLNRRQAESRWVPGKVRVDLGDEHRLAIG